MGKPSLDDVAAQPLGRRIWGARVEMADICFERAGNPRGPGSLDHISFAVGGGEIVGLGGPSGAGKTTILDIVAGLLAPSGGLLRIDGTALAPGRRPGIVYLGHEAALFAGSLRDNLLWFAPGKTDAEIEWAMRQVGGGELLGRNGAGIVMALTDGGGNLSAGERQRVALARGVLRGGSLFLLDEATSSLDIASERQVIGAIRALPGRPTIVLVSHRRETLSICDRVLELEDGRLRHIAARSSASIPAMPPPSGFIHATGV